jgi:small conductance mechanosensitive channel
MGISKNLTVVLVSQRVMLFVVPLLALLAVVGPMVSAATADQQPAAPAPGPVTTIDPEIALDDLALMLEPMTKAEVQTEADGWFALLRAKVREISVAELAVRRKNREIAQLEKVKAAAKELAQATSKVKTTQEAGGSGSHEDKTAATERLAAAKEGLARKVETANWEAAKETETVGAASAAVDAAPTAPMAEGAPATGAVLTTSVPVANDQAVMRRAVETAQKKSKKTGSEEAVEKTAAVAEKDAAVTEEVKSLGEVTPAAAEKALGSGSDTGGPAA